MDFNAKTITDIYSSKVAKTYDHSMSHMFARLKQKACDEADLQKGDHVLVFCCGTGLDFSHILKKIGREGRIVGVDFSREMLNLAEKKKEKYDWRNVELIAGDVTGFSYDQIRDFDAGVCTLGMSIIPDFRNAYHNLLSHVKDGGKIIIGDMQLASGTYARFNPLTIFLSKRYGGSYEGHNNSLELVSRMKTDLHDLRFKEFFLRSYYYCIGRK